MKANSGTILYVYESVGYLIGRLSSKKNAGNTKHQHSA
uniref:Uncharacterized protein n=1 Tax=Rheinheimera sp. BAL341 TaxID=1708203 RepID=A0A486XLN2_9GAMM